MGFQREGGGWDEFGLDERVGINETIMAFTNGRGLGHAVRLNGLWATALSSTSTMPLQRQSPFRCNWQTTEDGARQIFNHGRPDWSGKEQ